MKGVISKPTVHLGNTSKSSSGTASAYAKVSGAVQNQAAQKKAAKSAAWADLVGKPLTVCEAAAVWADQKAEKAAGYMDESFWGPGLMIGAYEVEAVKCFAYSQLENSIHLIIPEADVARMLRGAGLMLGGGFKCFGGFMLAAGSSTLSWTGLGVLGMAAGGFVVGAGASDMNQGWEEFFLGLSGDSTTQTRNGMSDLFYDGNDTIYHLSTGFAAFAGSLLTPYVNAAYGKTGVTATAGSTAGKTTGVKPTVAKTAGGTADDALEQFYDDIFESSYREQFDPVREQAIVGSGEVTGGGSKTIYYTEYENIYQRSIHNPNAEKIMLGKYDDGGATSYITKAGDEYTYFSLGKDWNTIKSTYGYTDEDMFKLFNEAFLDDGINAGKTFQFSHNPVNDLGALGQEYQYLIKNNYIWDDVTMTMTPSH